MSTEAAAPDAEVAALLGELRQIADEIRRTRDELAPLEAGLSAAAREYRNTVAPLEREARRLRAELEAITAPPAPDPVPVPAGGGDDGRGAAADRDQAAAPASPPDPEAVEKSMLLEHLYRVLDGMEAKGGDVVAEVQGLVQDPQATLADALEQVPWGPAWTDRSAVESVSEQVARLRTWRDALVRKRDDLRAAASRLASDSRYPLWRRREAGEETWRAFLAEAADQLRRDNDETAALIAELRGAAG